MSRVRAPDKEYNVLFFGLQINWLSIIEATVVFSTEEAGFNATKNVKYIFMNYVY